MHLRIFQIVMDLNSDFTFFPLISNDCDLVYIDYEDEDEAQNEDGSYLP